MPPERTAGPLRVFFYVQHLLGIGHLHRAARIAKALAGDGMTVELVLGGPPTPELDIGDATVIRLPPVKAGSDGFSALVHPDGAPFDEAAQFARAQLLGDAFDRFAPDVLITEAFPFGRRQMRFELLPLLERATARRPRPLVVASVRDILQAEHRPARISETLGLIDRFYDLVLVHGDPALIPLHASFPDADRFAAKTVYTGLVAPDPALAPSQTSPDNDPGVVVSVGGGAVGGPLLAAALRAKPLTRLADRPWLLLTGPNLSDGARALLAGCADPGIRVERFVPDLAQVLSRTSVSVSQAGYNTVADLLVGRCRSVLIPFARGGETEQSARASVLAGRGLAVVLAEEALAPEVLAGAIDRALDLPRPERTGLALDGARRTGEVLRQALANRTDTPHY